jgi:HlyD family secretion protein
MSSPGGEPEGRPERGSAESERRGAYQDYGGGPERNSEGEPPAERHPGRTAEGNGPDKRRRDRATARRRRKRIIFILLLAALAILLYLIFRPKPVEVETARVVRGPLQVTVTDEGKTRVRHRFTVSAPVTGRLERIRLEPGDPVTRGDVIARITPPALPPRDLRAATARVRGAESALEAARAAVVEARDAAAQAEREAARAERLHRAGALALQDLEQARLTARTRAAELDAATARVGTAAADLAEARAALVGPGPASTEPNLSTLVFSPLTGEVLRVEQKSERVVTAGTELLELGNPADLEVVVEVLSEEAVEIDVGDPIVIQDWGGGTTLSARVAIVEPGAFTEVSALGIEEQRVRIIGEFLEPTGPLGDQYRVEARIVVWQAPNVLKAPLSAIFRYSEGWATFVIEDGRARLRGVAIGHQGTAEVEILGGLAEGELLILHPGDQVSEGTRVRPRE